MFEPDPPDEPEAPKTKKKPALTKQEEQLVNRLSRLRKRREYLDTKRRNRIRILVGLAVTIDAEKRPETIETLRAILNRGLKGEHDRKFMKDEGWL